MLPYVRTPAGNAYSSRLTGGTQSRSLQLPDLSRPLAPFVFPMCIRVHGHTDYSPFDAGPRRINLDQHLGPARRARRHERIWCCDPEPGVDRCLLNPGIRIFGMYPRASRENRIRDGMTNTLLLQ